MKKNKITVEALEKIEKQIMSNLIKNPSDPTDVFYNAGIHFARMIIYVTKQEYLDIKDREPWAK